MFHRSERLFLRPAWPEDAEGIFAGIGDQGVACNLARAPWPYTIESARQFLARPRSDALPQFLATMPRAEGSEIIGMVGLNREDAGIELGYWIARPYWGQGLASEAVGAVIEVARTLGIERLTAGHFTDNPASGRVLAKNGFVPTGEIRAQFSLARKAEAPSLRYELDLAKGNDSPDRRIAA